MLNQVPRTLLNIGMDPSMVERDDDPDGSPPFDWNSLTVASETKAGDDGAPGGPSALITPSHVNRLNTGGGGRGAEFFGAGAGHEEGAPPPLPAARGRAARAGEKGGRGEGGGLVTPARGHLRVRSTFTNESIADQALKDFGDGAVSTAVVPSDLACVVLILLDCG